MAHPVSQIETGHSGCVGAFTVLELLVVVAIIVLLMALSVPALQKSQENARRLQCAARERQVLTALWGYQQENHGRFPRGDWPTPTVMGAGRDVLALLGEPTPTSALTSPAIQTLMCPSARPISPTDGAYYVAAGSYSLHLPSNGLYLMYLYAGGVGVFKDPVPHDAINWHGWRAVYDDPRNPGPVPRIELRSRHSDTALYTDRMWPSQGQTNAGSLLAPNNWSNPVGNIPPSHPRTDGSSDGGNVGYLDGHVAWRNITRVQERVLTFSEYRSFLVY